MEHYAIFATETDFNKRVAQEVLGRPLVFSELCHCERQRFLAAVNERRPFALIRSPI